MADIRSAGPAGPARPPRPPLVPLFTSAPTPGTDESAFPKDPDSFAGMLMAFLCIGSVATANIPRKLSDNGITHILNVSSFPSIPNNINTPGITTLDCPIDDSPSQSLFTILLAALEFIETANKDGCKIFVHCQAGISRSVAIVMCYMIWKTHNTPDAILTEIQKYRPCAGPNIGFSVQIALFAKHANAECNVSLPLAEIINLAETEYNALMAKQK
uniref:Protein-tyrosine-phosphatase n=1 Tax=viral metagenome TaxID=1070528 RepID=A0A6C0HLN8_9ZZZZ